MNKSKSAVAKRNGKSTITEWRRRNPAPRPIVSIDVPGQKGYRLDRSASDWVLFGSQKTGLSPADLITRAVSAESSSRKTCHLCILLMLWSIQIGWNFRRGK
jgi:hypothetical protein